MTNEKWTLPMQFTVFMDRVKASPNPSAEIEKVVSDVASAVRNGIVNELARGQSTVPAGPAQPVASPDPIVTAPSKAKKRRG